ncbi:alpha/beta-hydrolase [Mycena amicta]|nr:alpha/beta-hydrolase [Mycena amicta]
MCKLAALATLALLFQTSLATTFDPRAYTKSSATCQARNRAEEKDVDIDIRYVDINPHAKKTLLMVHGWPSLWSTWSNQIQEFQDEYHLVVPDLRGFGESTHPDDVRSSGTMDDMVRDMVCVLENSGVKSAICIGHDWGSHVCHTAARMRPDIFTGVVGISLPYFPAAADFTPLRKLITGLPTLSYQVYFDEHTTDAVAELAKDIRRTTRATLRTAASPPPEDFLKSTTSFLGAWADVAEIPPVPFFSSNEEDYFVEQYSIQKFKNTLQFYSEENRKLTWLFAQEQGNYTLPQPVLELLPTQDPVADWVFVSKILHSSGFLPNVKTELMDGSHWCHLEFPAKANQIIRAWLKDTASAAKEEEEEEEGAGHDEL